MVRILNKDGQLLAEIEGDSLRNAMLANKYLKGAQLAGQDLTGANLDDANLSQANLTGAVLEGVSLENTNLSEADLSKSKLDNAKLQRVDLSKANMEEATAVSATFVDVNFSNALARSCNFDDASFDTKEQNWFSMEKADFSKATFNEAIISCADVSQACFFGTDFSKCSGLTMVVTAHKAESESTRLYPAGIRFSDSIAFPEWVLNPCFDHETRWPPYIKFPKAKIPWRHIAKFAAICFGTYCGVATFSDIWLGLRFVESGVVMTSAIVLSIGLPFAWFWKRMKDINAEIELEPSLHFGRYASSRNEYQLGERIGEQEKEECQNFRNH